MCRLSSSTGPSNYLWREIFVYVFCVFVYAYELNEKSI